MGVLLLSHFPPHGSTLLEKNDEEEDAPCTGTNGHVANSEQ